MWLWGANPWAHSSDLPTPGDSTPTVLARRHWSGHQALGASCRTTADGGLPSSHRPEDLARSSHRTQKKKKKYPLFKLSHLFACKAPDSTRFLYDTCIAWYIILRHWVDFFHCSLNQSERLPIPPFDWGKLVYSVASQNPGLMRHALSKQRTPSVQRTKL